jgi:hypothetical protein
MDELQVLREFRSDIPGPDVEARKRALAQLLARIEPPRRSRHRVRVVVLVTAALAAAVALLPGRIGRDRKVDPVDRALAAVAGGPILHAVLEVPVQDLIEAPEPVHQTILDLASGAEQPVMARTEIWYDARTRRLHQIESVNGAVLLDVLETRRGTVDSAGGSDSVPPTIDPGLGAFFEGFKRALEDESVTVRASGAIGGRRVKWLRFPALPGQRAEEVAIDAKTYEPLLLRQLCPGCVSQPTYRIVALDGIRNTEADFTPPVRHGLHQVGRTKTAVVNVTLRRAASALGLPAIWPGRTVRGLRLTTARLSRVTARLAKPGARTARSVSRRGLTFFYGGRADRSGRVRVRPGEAYASVAESTGGGLRFEGFNLDVQNGAVVTSLGGGALPPPGSAVLTWREGGPWLVQLRAGGLYVEIESSSRDLAVAAARALGPVQRVE